MSNQEERIHACLDGELAREALTPLELQRLEALEGSLGDAATVLRQAPVPDFSATVMAALEAPRAHAAGQPALADRVFSWLWNPVSMAIRPAYAVAGLAMAMLGLVLLRPLPEAGWVADGTLVAGEEESSHLYVQFRIEVPGASRVAVAGTFTNWRPEHELTEISPGVWSAMVPLDPGVHDYTFVIDGERMVVDPYAPRVADSFGGSNSRLFLPVPSGSA